MFALKHLARPVLASLLMLLMMLGLWFAPLAVQVAGGGIIYLTMLFRLRVITREEIAALYRG